MRLLHLATRVLKEFNDATIPPYAILSHTWEAGEEVTLGEMQRVKPDPSSPHVQPGAAAMLNDTQRRQTLEKSGYIKIKRFCEAAAKDGFIYGWVDTCCIDKTSSSELSEAINSMYRWYQRAEVCYAYLSDVAWALNQGDLYLEQSSFTRKAFVSSKWFTRGWTLQELIAPSSVVFFNRNWEELGTKLSLKEVISEVTGIQVGVLLGADLESFSVAQRMSWASKRKTTRLEDQTYCLMGIFGVNMPMLYGEGHRAFTRLQEEIIRNTNDHSILAWSGEQWKSEEGLLAHSPAAFANSGKIMRCECYPMSIGLTNKGVHLVVVPARHEGKWMQFGPYPLYMSVLNCEEFGKPNQLIAICLKRASKDIFSRHSLLGTQNDRCWMTAEKPKMSAEQGAIFLPQHRSEDAYVPQRHHQEKPVSYEEFYVEINGFQGRMKWTEMYPQHWPVFGGQTGYKGVMANPYSDEYEVAAIRFTAGFDEPEDFVVLLERRAVLDNVLSANIFILHRSESLVDTVLKFAQEVRVTGTPGLLGQDKGPSDRVILQHGQRRISVIIKRRMIDNVRRLLVEISLIELPKR